VGREKGEGAACWFPIKINGNEYRPSLQARWKTNEAGVGNLMLANRLEATSERVGYVRFLDDFPVFPINNNWTDVGASFMADKVYVVQTVPKVIQRCLLMTTDPGDLVLDPTCGSGTTAYVAEQWGRRWITCDTSRVATTLAKQRLMAAEFDYYELAHTAEGVDSGFRYKTVPHVTLKSIANNPEIREGMTREQIDAAIARYADQSRSCTQMHSKTRCTSSASYPPTASATTTRVTASTSAPASCSPSACWHHLVDATPKSKDMSPRT
jgi:adenine-specific DNA-methyltransferase